MDACLAHAIEMLHIGNDACIDLQLHLFGIGRVLVSFLVCILESETLHTTSRDNFCPKIEGHASNNGGTNHVWYKESTATNACTYKGYEFASVGHLCGKEDDANEDKKRAEEVGVVGDEVEIVIDNDSSPRSLRLRETVDILIEIEHHTNTDNQYDGKEVSPEELSYDVAVDSFEHLKSFALLF